MLTETTNTNGWHWLRLGLALVYVMATAACIAPCLAGIRVPPTPAPTVPVSEDAAKRFQDKTGGLGAEGFRVELTEQEVTSYIALNLAGELPLTAPQVHFLPGRFILEGDLARPVRGRVQLTGTITVTEGRPQLELESASLGGIALPRSLLSSLSDSFLETAGIDNSQVELQAIELETGRIIVTGRARRP